MAVRGISGRIYTSLTWTNSTHINAVNHLLLRLPPELRNHIYQFTAETLRVGLLKLTRYPFERIVFHPSHASLVRTCRQIRYETAAYHAITLEVFDHLFTLGDVLNALTV